jgi:hypothetical protein
MYTKDLKEAKRICSQTNAYKPLVEALDDYIKSI